MASQQGHQAVARQTLSRDGPRGVQHLYFEVIRRLMDACKEDFRNDGIDVGEGSALDMMGKIWYNNLKETKVMHDDGLGATDRKGMKRTVPTRLPPRPRERTRERISAAMKTQIEEVIMLAADAAVTPQLTEKLQQHSSAAMSLRPQPSSVKILQSHGWNGSQFLGRVDGTLLRKMADALVVYLHRDTTEAPDPAIAAAATAQLAATHAAAAAAPPAAAAAAAPAAPGAAAAPAPALIPQTDGAGGVGDDAPPAKRTRYGDESSEEEEAGGAAASGTGASGGGDAELNSDDDDLLVEEEEETSLILCQYKKPPKKVKNKYTLDLQNGVMRIFTPDSGEYGREYVFTRAQAHLDWGK